jgi:hypothetical protein
MHTDDWPSLRKLACSVRYTAVFTQSFIQIPVAHNYTLSRDLSCKNQLTNFRFIFIDYNTSAASHRDLTRLNAMAPRVGLTRARATSAKITKSHEATYSHGR